MDAPRRRFVFHFYFDVWRVFFFLVFFECFVLINDHVIRLVAVGDKESARHVQVSRRFGIVQPGHLLAAARLFPGNWSVQSSVILTISICVGFLFFIFYLLLCPCRWRHLLTRQRDSKLCWTPAQHCGIISRSIFVLFPWFSFGLFFIGFFNYDFFITEKEKKRIMLRFSHHLCLVIERRGLALN